jgi:F5/8 type C domain
MNIKPGNDKKKALRNEPVEDVTSDAKDRDAPEPRGSGTGAGIVRRFVWPGVKWPLYVVFLVATIGLLLLGLDKLAEVALERTYLAEIYPSDFSKAKRDPIRIVSHYDYDFRPGTCLEYNLMKGNRYEYANNAGFREPRDIPLKKPKDEYRVFLTGGSTAFGLGATGQAVQISGWYGLEYRETISHIMEMILNASAPIPGKSIRVYNTAVWGHAYQHNLMRYLTKLRRYKPDLVVSLDGANDLPLVSKIAPDWRYFQEGQFHGVLNQIHGYTRPGLQSYLTLWLKNNTFLMSYLWHGKDILQVLHTTLPPENPGIAPGTGAGPSGEITEQELARMLRPNMDVVARMVENYHSVLENDGVKHVFALQPWFYSTKKGLHQREQKFQELGDRSGHSHYYGIPSGETYRLLTEVIKRSAAEKGYFLVDFSEYFDDVSEWVFSDWCHLTSGANYLLAKELSNHVRKQVLVLPLSEDDRVDAKDSYFWNLLATAKFVSVPPSDGPENAPENMLSGYPGDRVYASKGVSLSEPLEVVLDLGKVYPVSRLRIVWADDKSVPERWAFETSQDGTSWETMVKSNAKHVDHFSQWPGFEYYGSRQVYTRYIKYKPLGAGERKIRLRSISAYR